MYCIINLQEVSEFVEGILAAALSFAKYDPNYAYGDSDDGG
jgi:hypothetical protein